MYCITAGYFQVLFTVNVLSCHNPDRVDESFSMWFPSLLPFHLVSHCNKYVIVFQRMGHVGLYGTPGTAARQASLSFTISRGLLKLMPIESVMPMPSNHFVHCHPLLLPSIFHSIGGCFSLNARVYFISLFYWGGKCILQSSVATTI